MIKEFVYLAELPIAVLTPAANYYIYADQLNTPRAVTNISNTIIWQWLGDPFGTTLADTDPDNDGVNFNFNLRFAGQYYDAESGLHYNYFRDYNPSTGRYIEPDPIGLNGGVNLYGYVGGSPVSWSDPYGLATAGHHIFPQSIWRGLNNLSKDVKQLFDKAVVKPASRHGYSKEHAAYNRIAKNAWNEFCNSANNDLNNMSRDTAQDFLDYLNSNSEISTFNEQIQSGEPLTMPNEAKPLPEIIRPTIELPVIVEPVIIP